MERPKGVLATVAPPVFLARGRLRSGSFMPRRMIERRRQAAAGVEYSSGRQYGGRVLRLTVHNTPRRQVIWLLEQPIFDNVILLLIVLNTVLLGIDGTGESSPPWMEQAMLALLCVFTVELLLKVFAMGLFTNKHAYLRSSWNILDCVIVLTGWGPYLLSSAQSMSALRVMRAIRPLRTINQLPGLRALIDSMIRSLPGLANVSFLLVSVSGLFAIAGMQLFGGRLRFRCVEERLLVDVLGDLAQLPTLAGSALADLVEGEAEADALAICRPEQLASGLFVSGEQASCALGELCVELINPMRGSLSFDSLPEALLAIFAVLSLEGWADTMYLQVDAAGWHGVLYCVLLVLVGALALLNLLRAIVCDTFVPADKVDNVVVVRPDHKKAERRMSVYEK